MHRFPLVAKSAEDEKKALDELAARQINEPFLRFGGELRHYDVNFFFNFYSRGQISFNTFKDFLQGTPALGFLGNGIRARHYRSTDMAWFMQDDYRVTNYLTVNAGMRVGRNGGISDRDGLLSNFDPAEYAAIGHVCTTTTPCSTNNGFHLLNAGDTLNPNDWYAAPRAGFSLRPFKQALTIGSSAGVILLAPSALERK